MLFPPFELVSGPHAPEPLIVLLAALIVDALLGDMPRLFRLIPHPVVLIGRLIAEGERRLNRMERSDGVRKARGVIFLLFMLAVGAGAGLAISFVARTLPHAWIIEVFAAAVLIAQRSLHDHVAKVADALDKGGVAAGRQAVSHIVGRDPQSLDGAGVARAAIESGAENFSDAVVAPVFWYLLLGLPGLVAYKVVNTLDSMIGHRSPRYRAFGWASARFDDLVNLVPARLAGLLIVLAAAFAPKAAPLRALKVMLRDHHRHKSPNSGWPEAAMAGALDLSLAGPRHYPNLPPEGEWIGAGRTQASATDIQLSLALYRVACLIQFGGVVGLLWWKAVA